MSEKINVFGDLVPIKRGRGLKMMSSDGDTSQKVKMEELKERQNYIAEKEKLYSTCNFGQYAKLSERNFHKNGGGRKMGFITSEDSDSDSDTDQAKAAADSGEIDIQRMLKSRQKQNTTRNSDIMKDNFRFNKIEKSHYKHTFALDGFSYDFINSNYEEENEITFSSAKKNSDIIRGKVRDQIQKNFPHFKNTTRIYDPEKDNITDGHINIHNNNINDESISVASAQSSIGESNIDNIVSEQKSINPSTYDKECYSYDLMHIKRKDH